MGSLIYPLSTCQPPADNVICNMQYIYIGVVDPQGPRSAFCGCCARRRRAPRCQFGNSPASLPAGAQAQIVSCTTSSRGTFCNRRNNRQEAQQQAHSQEQEQEGLFANSDADHDVDD
jgi:hypothetical protein